MAASDDLPQTRLAVKCEGCAHYLVAAESIRRRMGPVCAEKARRRRETESQPTLFQLRAVS